MDEGGGQALRVGGGWLPEDEKWSRRGEEVEEDSKPVEVDGY